MLKNYYNFYFMIILDNISKFLVHKLLEQKKFIENMYYNNNSFLKLKQFIFTKNYN